MNAHISKWLGWLTNRRLCVWFTWQRARALVELVDLYPTALELMGIDGATHVPDFAELEGTSFAPLLSAG